MGNPCVGGAQKTSRSQISSLYGYEYGKKMPPTPNPLVEGEPCTSFLLT